MSQIIQPKGRPRTRIWFVCGNSTDTLHLRKSKRLNALQCKEESIHIIWILVNCAITNYKDYQHQAFKIEIKRSVRPLPLIWQQRPDTQLRITNTKFSSSKVLWVSLSTHLMLYSREETLECRLLLWTGLLADYVSSWLLQTQSSIIAISQWNSLVYSTPKMWKNCGPTWNGEPIHNDKWH